MVGQGRSTRRTARRIRPKMRTHETPRLILVTGATGTVGRTILPALAGLGAPVRALAHRTEPSPAAMRLAEFRSGDLEQPGSIRGLAEGCDVVVHAARRAGFMVLDRDRQRRIMIGGTEAMLREARSAGASTFIQIGYTGTVQERGPWTGAVDEETPPEGEYESESVRIQYEAEAMVLEANRAGSFRTMVVSPGVLASPRVPTPLGALLGAFLRRELPYRLLDDVWIAVSEGSDVARCVAAAVVRGHGGRRYFATGECLTLGNIYERASRLTGVPAPRRRIPNLLLEELGHLVPVLPPQSFLRQIVLPRELVLHLVRLAPLTNARTRTELGFTPVPLDELILGFARTEGVLPRTAGAAG